MNNDNGAPDSDSNGVSTDLRMQTVFHFPQHQYNRYAPYSHPIPPYPIANHQPPTSMYDGMPDGNPDGGGGPHRPRRRRTPSTTPPKGKSATVKPAFPWADEYRATIRSLVYLRENKITVITGDVQCKKCDHRYTMKVDLEQRFEAISTYIAKKKDELYQRAPKEWCSPVLPTCELCGQENCVKPVMAEKKRDINWPFLLLTQMLGCCTLEQLKYYCKHTKNHRTGAKDRVLFSTYLGLCKQLDPTGPYDV